MITKRLQEQKDKATRTTPVASRKEALDRLVTAIRRYGEQTEHAIASGHWSDRGDGFSARAHLTELRTIRAALGEVK